MEMAHITIADFINTMKGLRLKKAFALREPFIAKARPTPVRAKANSSKLIHSGARP